MHRPGTTGCVHIAQQANELNTVTTVVINKCSRWVITHILGSGLITHVWPMPAERIKAVKKYSFYNSGFT